jgi:hypothetical protein
MSIIGSDPLAFLTAQGGVVGTPLTEGGASGADNLDQKQRGAVIGESIPIVFCRRTDGTGGVLISPPATEAAFSNNANNDVTASYLLVLSEGQIDSIQVRDVFQRSCRVGSFTQTYNRRAGTFVLGNTITDIVVAAVQFSFQGFTEPEPITWYNATKIDNVWRFILDGVTYNFGTGTFPAIDSVKRIRTTGGNTVDKPEAPSYCGTGGTYEGLSTMAFSVTIPAGFDYWNRQVHCFIRGGIYVSRLLDSVTGPSNNVADLVLYLLRNSSRVPEAMIDTATSFLAAATFTNANGFWFNGVVGESTNLRDWIGGTLQYFLLRQARIGGKEALKPLVPTNSNGTIKTTAVTWAFTFTEQHIIPDSFEIIYVPLADRKSFCASMLWRQQDDLGIPVMRITEVRYSGTAEDGPFEQHDLSGYCASENHAVKIGAYILSKRRHVTHRLRISVRPDNFNNTLTSGDLVRVRLERVTSTGASSLHNYLYEVDRISKSITGQVLLELTHFPVDANLASVVAQEVAVAVGGGLLLPTGLTGITCDVNSSSDTSVPAETFTDNPFPDYGFGLDALVEPMLEDFSISNSVDWPMLEGFPISNSADWTGPPILQFTSDGDIDAPEVGDTLTPPAICDGGIVAFYVLDPSVPGGKVLDTTATTTYTMVLNDVDLSIYGEIRCPDPSSPTGYGEPIPVGPTPIIAAGFDPTIYQFWRLNYQNGFTSAWFAVNALNPPGVLTAAAIASSGCSDCTPFQYSPTPASFFPWSRDLRWSASGPTSADGSNYAQIVTQQTGGSSLQSSTGSYNTGAVDCVLDPRCDSGSGGVLGGIYEFTDNQALGSQASWEGQSTDYAPFPTPPQP